MQIEATGKNVESAIQNGLLECGMKREEVEVKVLEEGGLFKKAKVILSWGEKVEAPVEETKPEVEQTSEEVVEAEVEETETQPEEKKKRIVDTARLEKRGCEFLLGLAKLVDENATVEAEAGEKVKSGQSDKKDRPDHHPSPGAGFAEAPAPGCPRSYPPPGAGG